ncbi:MAG: zinc ribbon domain-containing protein [Anaerolineales bacterium]|nr:zinc ribbon domain-containing protein [Anaerolineales bacterium]
MSFIIGLLIALLISGLAIAAVVWPLLKRGPAPVLIEDDRLTELLHRKEQVLASIKELEFDYSVGKLSEADYQQYDQRLRRQAIGLMQQIEQLAPESAGVDATLEHEIQRRRLVTADATASPPVADVSVEAEIARRRRISSVTSITAAAPLPANGGTTKYCTECGSQVSPQHKFCANCGAPLAELAAAPQ